MTDWREISPFAWPERWREDAGYTALYHRLLGQYGSERTMKIVCGLDEPTNQDMQSWRAVGRR